jgi:hypothetical protein
MRVSPILGPALGAVVGGVLGALVTLAVATPKTTKKGPERVEAEAVGAASAPELEGRVAALERAVQRLHQRALLPSSLSSAKPGSADGTSAPTAPGDTSPVVDDPVFEAAVRDVVQRVEEERDADRELERSERRRQMADEWVNGLAATLKLNDQQKVKVGEIATQFFQSLRELRNSDAGIPNREAFRAQIAELRGQAETKLGEVLDGTQMQTYQALEEEQRLGARPGRNRGQWRGGEGQGQGRGERRD